VGRLFCIKTSEEDIPSGFDHVLIGEKEPYQLIVQLMDYGIWLSDVVFLSESFAEILGKALLKNKSPVIVTRGVRKIYRKNPNLSRIPNKVKYVVKRVLPPYHDLPKYLGWKELEPKNLIQEWFRFLLSFHEDEYGCEIPDRTKQVKRWVRNNLILVDDGNPLDFYQSRGSPEPEEGAVMKHDSCFARPYTGKWDVEIGPDKLYFAFKKVDGKFDSQEEARASFRDYNRRVSSNLRKMNLGDSPFESSFGL